MSGVDGEKKRMPKNKFKIGDKLSYVHLNGDTSPCEVIATDGKGYIWVKWEKDGFINWWPDEKRFFKKAKNKPQSDETGA